MLKECNVVIIQGKIGRRRKAKSVAYHKNPLPVFWAPKRKKKVLPQKLKMREKERKGEEDKEREKGKDAIRKKKTQRETERIEETLYS